MKNWSKLTAADVMTSPVITVDLGTRFEGVADLLDEHHISGSLVVDLAGRPVGVVSLSDLARHVAALAFDAEPDAIVDDLMTSRILSVDERTPLPEVVRTMSKKGVHRLFVMSRGKATGVISTMDILRALSKRTPPHSARIPRVPSARI